MSERISSLCFFSIGQLTRALLYFLFFLCFSQSLIAFIIVVLELCDSVLSFLKNDLGLFFNSELFFHLSKFLSALTQGLGRQLFTSNILKEVGAFYGVVSLQELAFLGKGSVRKFAFHVSERDRGKRSFFIV